MRTVIGITLGVVSAIIIGWGVATTQAIRDLRTDVNRVSNIQLRCARAIAYGHYLPNMMSQCIDDYIQSGIVEPDLP